MHVPYRKTHTSSTAARVNCERNEIVYDKFFPAELHVSGTVNLDTPRHSVRKVHKCNHGRYADVPSAQGGVGVPKPVLSLSAPQKRSTTESIPFFKKTGSPRIRDFLRNPFRSDPFLQYGERMKQV